MSYFFPFGQPLTAVKQEDRKHKKVFILGVYASAMHARWKGINGKIKIKALAVASEPYIFWRGDGSEEIIRKIPMPEKLGSLEPALPMYNGPTGKTLDEEYLKPLGLSRQDVWLCDLLPYARINTNQRKAIEKHYEPIVDQFNLPFCTVPNFTKTELKNQKNRHLEILKEVEESNCDTIIFLGDLPIKYWLSHFSDYRKLSDFGATIEKYGKPLPIKINRKNYEILPLVHPRQASKLGRASRKWTEIHKQWVSNHNN